MNRVVPSAYWPIGRSGAGALEALVLVGVAALGLDLEALDLEETVALDFVALDFVALDLEAALLMVLAGLLVFLATTVFFRCALFSLARWGSNALVFMR